MAVNFSVTFSCAPGILKDTRMDLPEFLELFDAHHLPVYRFALRLAGSVADAEDIVQECFLGLLKPGSSYDPKRAPLRTYLFGVAWKQFLKRSARKAAVEPGPGPPSPEHETFQAEMRNAVARADRRRSLSDQRHGALADIENGFRA